MIKTSIKIYNTLRNVVTEVYHKLHLEKYETPKGRKELIPNIDAVTLAIFKQSNGIATKKSLWKIITPKCSYKTLIVPINKTFEILKRIVNYMAISNRNGSENRGDFHKFLGERGIAHYFIPKSSPQWDGSVERAYGVIDQEYYLNPRRTWKTLSEYLMWYNYERIHLGKYLNGMIPIEKWQDYQLKVSPLKVN
ncbi:hypothetical protein IT400_02965 [Candidatus Nomurabacteria bacterium]|nr:hypothetical protein [Candidatus Nomurabacteria bacterium]